MKSRYSGVLAHITALPSRYGIGDFGPEGRYFADFLSNSKQKIWQILPVNPTSPRSRNSPYSVISSFALNGLLISPEDLVQKGLLAKSDLEDAPVFEASKVDFIKVIRYKRKLFRTAFEKFKSARDAEYEKFCEENKFWLDNYAAFVTLKDKFSPKSWVEWPKEFRDRNPKAIQKIQNECGEEFEFARFLQFISFEQYFKLKAYANSRNVSIFGDLPIYVDLEGSDCWSNPEVFKLDKEKNSVFIAGVPPDYFSKTGQLWKNPVYNWEYLKDNDFPWWAERIKHNLKLFDFLRLDHFIGFIKYWEVPKGERTAVNGKYRPAYGEALLKKIRKETKKLPVIAEDLGVLTQDVIDARRRLGLPGMKILQFAFGDDFPDGAYLPHNFSKNSAVYTGTHDNNTVLGWFLNEANKDNKHRVSLYADKEINESNVCWELIKLGIMSSAKYAIFPIQDIQGLGREARFNLPSTTRNNWVWRINNKKMLSQDISNKLAHLTYISGRF